MEVDEIDVPVFLRLMLVREGRAVMDFENCSYDHKLRRRKEVTKFIQAIRDGDFSGVKKWEALESVDFSTLQKYGVENLLVVHARQQQTPQPEEESHRNPTSTAPLCPVPDSLLESIRFVQEPPAAKDVTPSVVMDIDLESLSSAGISEQLTSDNVGDLSSAPLPQGAANFRCSTPVLKDSPDLAFLKDLNIPDMEQPSVREVLQFWVVATNTALEHVTLLLKLLKQAGITGIPDTAFWLLNNKELKSVKQNLRKSERIILEKRVKSNGQIVEDRQKIGKFVYFGLREGLLNRSPGNVQYFEQLDALREAYILAPEVFTEELFNATFSKPTSPDNWLAVVDFLKKTSPRHQNCTFAKSACIHVDLNFDGIQLFKTGVKETIPLLARITAISTDAGKVFLFSKKMPAFMFGVYCGKGKPDTNELMTELVDELQAGHPQMNALLRMPEETFSTISENLQRYFFTMPRGTFEESNAESEPTPNQTDSSGFSSETNLPTASGSTTPMIDSTPTPKPDEKLTSIAVDRFISDALARRDWTGTVAHSAFWALPRCKQRGFKGAKTGMHYEVIDCTSIRRYDEEWEDYLQPEDTETQGKVHLRELALITTVPGVRMVSQFVIDPMHTSDGGLLKHFLTTYLGKGSSRQMITESTLNSLAELIEGYIKYSPTEFKRRICDLKKCGQWKLRTVRNFFYYVSTHILREAEFENKKRGKKLFLQRQVRRLVHGLRLIAGHSVKPVHESHIQKASRLFRRFMTEMKKVVGKKYISFTHHNFLHLVDDIRTFYCHLDRNSAYVFENFHQKYNKRVRPGPKPEIQLLNRLCELYVHQQRLDEDTKRVVRDPFTESTIAYLMKNATPGTNEVPFNTAKQVNFKRKGVKSLKFEGFELRETFPQNVCLLKDGDIFLCESFKGAGDSFIISGKRSQKVGNVYVGPEGCSRSVGICEVEGFSAISEKIVASSVSAKCFALPAGRVTINDALKDPTDGERWFMSALIE